MYLIIIMSKTDGQRRSNDITMSTWSLRKWSCGRVDAISRLVCVCVGGGGGGPYFLQNPERPLCKFLVKGVFLFCFGEF